MNFLITYSLFNSLQFGFCPSAQLKPLDLHFAQTESLPQARVLVPGAGWGMGPWAYWPIRGPFHLLLHTVPPTHPVGCSSCLLALRPWSIDPAFSLHCPWATLSKT